MNKAFQSRMALALCLMLVVTCPAMATSTPARKLFVFNWSRYMNPAIIKAFEHQYHVKVVRSFYDSNAQLFAKLQAGGVNQYDVIVPSNYYVPRLIKTHLIQPLDKTRIPNLDNLKPRFRHPAYDLSGRYTAAYQWGTTGIAYNSQKLPGPPKSWAMLFKPGVNSRYPFAIGPDAQVMLGAACAYQGHGYGCTGRRNWKQAGKLLAQTRRRRNFSGFVAGTPVLQQLARGVVDVGVTFNGDYAYYKTRDPKTFAHIKYIIPKEGAELWVDTMAIPAGAPHPVLANEFINFILKASIGAKLSNWNSYATPNAQSQPLLDEPLRRPPVTPTRSQMSRLHFTPSLKGRQLQFVQQLWTEIKSR